MYNTFRYLKLSSKYILLLLFFQTFVCSYDYSTQSSEENDFFVEAYELLDEGEYEKSFTILKDCVHYDLRCLTLIGKFYYLGLKPVERDVCNALYIWKVCSDYGSSDAQFYLGVMYSNYFSLPNLYSYYEEENRIEDNIILFRAFLFLKVKYLEKEIADCIYGRKEKYDNEDKNRKFRSVPIVKFTNKNELILKIKNIRYNIDELKLYFNNLNKFSNKNDKGKDRNINYNYTRNHNLSLLYFYSSNLANHPGSILALGIKYMNGYGVEKDCEVASRYYLKLTNDIFNSDEKTEFEIIDLIRLNVPYYDRYSMNNKKIKSIEILLETSLHDNHKILTMIARRYLIGIDGVKKDYKKAHNYLTKAAKYKNSEAISLLGYIYLLGLGVKIDYNRAIEYFIEGNKLKDSLSYNGLGYMHFFGLGNFKRNENLAFYYFELAAKDNLSSAQFNLACMYLSGIGTPQSFQSAFYWFYKSLNNGNLLAAYIIGFMHYNGIITSRNCKLALSLLSKVAENNSFIINTTNKIIRYTERGRDKEALFLMALLAETGCLQSQINISNKIINSEFSLFLPSDSNSKKIYASRYLAMASESNDFKSLYTLGDYAYNGYGIYVHLLPKNNLPIDTLYDLNNNKYLYKKNKKKKKNDNNKKINTSNNKNILTSSNEIISTDFIDEQGFVFNNKWRFNYSFKFSFNKIDYELAYHHYKSIISFYPNNIYVIQTISRACYNLGYMYYYGIGVPRNIEKAMIYFNSSIKVYPSYKVPSVLFVLYIKFNKYLYNLKKKIKKFFNFL
ncbi:ubiquitin-protein ligase, putative [Plasmodium gallinaceum]|uniref:Ubiquitin-protein ligase, putative n=1 Tax=Plasmodium gallinaceum TaxID=5849 RepID=A0A1J1GQA0_PLAGA|nr:ubiquitin-protein ligase, putative [Plasmodium gallinaceum]CRG94679.1 ubiquitin-protein ligase, putative [Plasmodium gallinaceum]